MENVGQKIGYARVSTQGQDLEQQRVALGGANRENGNSRTLSVLCQVEVVEVDAAASENAEIDPNLTWGE